MSIKFEKPIHGDEILFIGPRDFTEKKLKKSPDGRKYIKVLQNAIDNKLVKFKSVSEMLKHHAKKDAKRGACIGEVAQIIKEIKEHGVKKGIPKKASKIASLAHTHLFNFTMGLNAISKSRKNGLQRSKVAKVCKKDKLNLKNITPKKTKSFTKKAEIIIDKPFGKSKPSKLKRIKLSKTDKITKHFNKLLKKDENSSSLIYLLPKKASGSAHVITAGINKKKPFFYDSNIGYARPKNTKELLTLIKKKCLQNREHVKMFKQVGIQHLKNAK